MFLTDYVVVKLGFDFVRGRNVFDVQYGFFLFLRLFLFYPLLVGNPSLSLQIRNIYKTDIGKTLAV